MRPGFNRPQDAVQPAWLHEVLSKEIRPGDALPGASEGNRADAEGCGESVQRDRLRGVVRLHSCRHAYRVRPDCEGNLEGGKLTCLRTTRVFALCQVCLQPID